MPSPPTELSTAGADLWCVDRGAGLPLLLVHGFPLDHSMWAAQIDDFSHRCRVIAPDLRGLGKNPVGDADRTTMSDFADDLVRLLDRLAIREPVVFCGLSMGGYIALQFWRKYADRLRGLVFCDTRSAADTPQAAADRLAMADRVLREGPGPLIEHMLPRLFAETTRRQRPELAEQIRDVMLRNDRRSIAAAARGMADRPDMTASLGEIRCPTLLLAGQSDVLTPAAEMRRMAEAIPGAKFTEIPAAGHMAPMENPAEVNAAMRAFLAGDL